MGVRRRKDLVEGLTTALGIGAGTGDERFLVLTEPNMIEDFDTWKVWHARISAVAEFLQELGRIAFQRTSHLGGHGQDVPAHTVVTAMEVRQRWEALCSS